MAPQLSALAALPEDTGVSPSTHMVTHNHCSSSCRGSEALSSGHHGHCTHSAHTHVSKTLKPIQFFKKFKFT